MTESTTAGLSAQGIQLGRFMRMDRDDDAFGGVGHRREIADGAVLLQSGQIPDACCYIESGRIMASVVNAQGTERILFFYEKGSMPLVQNVLTDRPTDLTYCAVEPTTVRCLSREELLAAMQANSVLAMHVLRSLSEAGCSSEQRLLEDVRFSAEGKVCDQLLELAALYGRRTDAGVCIELKMRQQTMASLLGLHRVTLVNIVRRLRELGLVEYSSGHYCIRDLHGLQAYRDEHCLDFSDGIR